MMAAAAPLAEAAPQPQSAPGAENHGRTLSRVDERAGSADLPRRIRLLMSARLCEAHGFQGVFVGSSAPNQELVGLPDQAVVTVSELLEYNSVIAANLDIPILADLDDLGATPLNVYRFAKQADRAGIGCASFDDRMPLNRATAYAVPGVVSKARMIDNIHAAVDGRTDMVLSSAALLRLRTVRTRSCWIAPPPTPKPAPTPYGSACGPRRTTSRRPTWSRSRSWP